MSSYKEIQPASAGYIAVERRKFTAIQTTVIARVMNQPQHAACKKWDFQLTLKGFFNAPTRHSCRRFRYPALASFEATLPETVFTPYRRQDHAGA